MTFCSRFVIKIFAIFVFWSLLIFALIQYMIISLEIRMPRIIQPQETTEVLLIDKAPKLSEDLIIDDLQERYPNLPISYWYKHRRKPMEVNKTCARFPNVMELEFNNLYWQTLRTVNGTFQLYGAYLDVRPNNHLGPTVRILGMIDRIAPSVITYCQFWFEGEKRPVFEETVEYKYVWNKRWGNYKQGIYQPYLIACVIPTTHKDKVPASISLVEKPCNNSTNNLRVIFNRPAERKDFAVCVKGLDYIHDDLSVRLVEWIELINLLGADKIFFYQLEVHRNISKVLKHYEQEGKIQVTPTSLAGTQPNLPAFQHLYLTKKITNKRQNEVIPYNDCFYKHMYEYKYIVLLDVDEVIMPIEGKTWQELMVKVLPKALKIKNQERASYNVRNVYFLDDLLHNHEWFDNTPKYMHMLQHVYRTRNFTKPGNYIKCFHNTEKVISLHNHFPFACFGNQCTTYSIETADAQLQHYRADCVNELKKSCKNFKENSVLDTTIWKFKETLIGRVTTTLRTLGFLSCSSN